MLFSLRELSSSLSPSDGPVGDLHLVKTGASTLYNFETVSGLRFCLYTTPESVNSSSSGYNNQGGSMGSNDMNSMMGPGSPSPNISGTSNIGTPGGVGVGGGPSYGGMTPGGGSGGGGMTSLAQTESIRSALRHVYEHIWVSFVVRSPMYHPSNPNIGAKNFEASLDNYLKGQSWFRS